MFKKTPAKLFLAFIFFFSAVFAPLSAQESLAEVYGKIDVAFVKKIPSILDDTLKQYKKSTYYSLYENYALKRTRQQVISGRLELARDMALVIIDNNLENFDAMELYSYIDKGLLNEEEKKAIEEDKKRIEAEKQAVKEEKIRTQLKPTYSTIQSASGKKLYLSEAQAQYSAINWDLFVGIADLMLVSITSPSQNGTNYGVSAELDITYQNDKIIFGGDLFGNFEFLPFASEFKDSVATAKIVPKLAFPRFKHFFIRAGFGAFMNFASNEIASYSVGTMLSPLIGFGWENQAIGSSTFKATFEYCLGHLAKSDINAAFNIGASILLPLSESEHTKVGLKFGLDDLLYLKSDGIENKCNIILAIGVGNVKK